MGNVISLQVSAQSITTQLWQKKKWSLNRLGKGIWSYYWHFPSNLNNTRKLLWNWPQTEPDVMFRRCTLSGRHCIHCMVYDLYTCFMVPTWSLFPGKVLSLKHGRPGPGKVLTFEYFWLKSGKSPYFQSLCQNSNDQHHRALVVVFPSGDVELFGNPSDPLTNHRCCVVWRHLVPAKIRVSLIKSYYVVTESQSAHTLDVTW